MKWWTYLIPRLIIVSLLGLVAWLSLDSMLRRALVANAESLTGAKVEIGQLKLNLDQQKVFLQEVQVADPRNTDVNLFQADMAYLDVDFGSLLRRKIKITGGRTSDLRFGSPRTSPGALTANSQFRSALDEQLETRHDTPQPSVGATAEPTPLTNELESRWLDRLQEQIVSSDAPQLQSATTLKALAVNWSPRLSEARQQLKQINVKIEELKDSLADQDSNPLRQDLEDATSDLAELQQQTSKIQNKLASLHTQAHSDKTKLATIQQADQRAIEQLASIQSFDGDVITQLLLVESQKARVDEIIRWFQWFRNAVPNIERDFQTQTVRGADIKIPPLDGKTVAPDFLIEDLDIEGAGHFAGQFLNFAGKLNHLSSQPKFHSEPTTFDLRAQGKQHFVVKCELDRRADLPTDSLEVRCPDLQIKQSPLGSDRSLLVTVGPNLKLQADVRLKAIGDALAGELVFRHSNVSLHVDHLHSLAGGTEMALRLNQELTACDQFETRLMLSGTVDHYQIKIESDLGNRFAQSMNQVSAAIQRQHLAARRQQWKESTEKQSIELTAQIDEALKTLEADAQVASQWVERTRVNISSTAKPAWPSIR